MAGNAPGKFSYANITGKPSGKKVNVRTLFTPGGNGIDVVVPVDSVHAISERSSNTAYGFFLGKKTAYHVVANYVRNTWIKYGLVRSMFSSSTGLFSFQFSSMDGLYSMLENGPYENGLSAIATKLGTPLILDSYTSDMCMQSWGWSSYVRVMIEFRADVELKDNIFVAMPKITREGHYTCNVRVEYQWKPPRCSSYKVFGHIHEECLKNTGAGEKKTVKKPSQTSRGIQVGPKMGFKPQKEYIPVPKKAIASFSGNKKKGVKPTIEVSNSNPFDVLNSVDNDEELVIDGQAILVDKDGNPLKKVEYPCDHDSEDDVASVDNDMARDMASERTGFGTQSFLEQWRDSYGNGDYDEDPYDDDMYEGQDLSEEIQTICDKLDIRVRGRKKQ
ncbi:retrotransposon protein, putative, ty1-copia subclass [Tanacetum coccineum]